MARNIQILVANPGYTISGGAASVNDEFIVRINGTQQTEFANSLSVNMSPTPGSAAISFFTDDVGTLTLELNTEIGLCSWDQTAEVGDGDNELVTSELYGTSTISPVFSLILILGCIDNTRGVNPDINGLCDASLGEPFNPPDDWPTSPYCKMGVPALQSISAPDGSGATLNDVGYQACNYNPIANYDPDDNQCFYSGYIDDEGNQQESGDYCDCFGHEEDCSGNCLSQHSIGWCSFDVFDLSSNQLGVYDSNGTGCDIKVCDTSCVVANDFIRFWREGSDGQCEDHGGSTNWGCDYVDQGAGHPLILDMVERGMIENTDINGDGYIDSTTGRLNYNCGHTDCYNCANVCMNSPFDGLPAEQGLDDCGECIYGATMDSHQCWPIGTNPELTCSENWSQDCAGRCPNIPGYVSPCYNRDDYTDGTCGYDCNNVCDGSGVMQTCGCDTPIPDGDCDCNNNQYDCLGVCDGDAFIDECDNCCLGNIIYVDGSPTEQFCGIPEDECDCSGNVVGCDGVCGSLKALDDCGVCDGGNYFTLNGVSTAEGGTSCIQYTSNICFNSLNQSCNCTSDNEYDCTVDIASSIEDFTLSCGGSAVVDNCGVCGGGGACAGQSGSLGSNIEDECCDCNNNIVDCAGVCGGNSYRDNCGECRDYEFQFTGEMNAFDVSGYPLCETYGGSGIYIQCCVGDITGTACDGQSILKWCYDGGDNDGQGCGNCTDTSTTPIYQCENPTGTQVGTNGNFLWTQDCNDNLSGDTCYCPPPGNMDIGGLCVDACGTCYGYGNEMPDNDGYQVICGGGGGCCSDEVCGCDNVCGSTAELDCNGCCINNKIAGNAEPCTFIGYGSGTSNQATNGVDACGVCGGSGIPDGDCDCAGNVADCAGICGGNSEEFLCPDGECGYSIPDGDCDCNGGKEDCAGICGGSSELDACGVCAGVGYENYYPDPDGDGLICPQSNLSSFCSNAAQLQADVNICGVLGNPCWLREDAHEDWGLFTETSASLCQCPFTYNECGDCIDVDDTGNQPTCTIDTSSDIYTYHRTCDSDSEYGNQPESDPCNSRFCKKITYQCVENEYDNSYYKSYWVDTIMILGNEVVVQTAITLPPEYQQTTTEPPSEDDCDNWMSPQCSQYYGEPSSGVYPVEGGDNPCQQFANIEGISVPTNPMWNAACLDCLGTFGNAILTCSGCYDSVMPTITGGVVQPSGNCNVAFACETIINQTDGTTIDMDCDGGDCRDCLGVCNGTATEQWNTHETEFTDFESVNYCGCSTEEIRYHGASPHHNVLCCMGIPDCNGVCPEVVGYIGGSGNNGVDCAGTCGGDAVDIHCCDNIEYCIGTGTYADASTCDNHVFCGCYNDETACNYDINYVDTVSVFFNGVGLANIDYTCKYPEDVCDPDTYGVDIGDCCGCMGEIIDCSLECEIQQSSTSNDPLDWYHDYDCNGLGNGDMVMVACQSQLPQTIGCWSNILDPEENDFCENILWNNNDIPSTGGIPNEDYICKTLESVDGDTLCGDITENEECISTEGCKWERDYFFGVDNCNNCFRTGVGDAEIQSNFNKWGETAEDCAGVCNGDATLDQCGICDGDGTSCAGCMDENADNYDDQATENCTNYANHDFANGCCEYPTDCMGISSQDYGNNPAFFDLCGICSSGTSTHVANNDVSCLCCPPESSNLYPISIDDGTYAYSTFEGEDNMWYRYGKCWNGLGSKNESESWIEPYNPYTEDDYPNFTDCSGSCWGIQEIDDCGVCGGESNFSDALGAICGCDGEIIDDCGQCTQEPLLNTTEGVFGQQCSCNGVLILPYPEYGISYTGHCIAHDSTEITNPVGGDTSTLIKDTTGGNLTNTAKFRVGYRFKVTEDQGVWSYENLGSHDNAIPFNIPNLQPEQTYTFSTNIFVPSGTTSGNWSINIKQACGNNDWATTSPPTSSSYCCTPEMYEADTCDMTDGQANGFACYAGCVRKTDGEGVFAGESTGEVLDSYSITLPLDNPVATDQWISVGGTFTPQNVAGDEYGRYLSFRINSPMGAGDHLSGAGNTIDYSVDDHFYVYGAELIQNTPIPIEVWDKCQNCGGDAIDACVDTNDCDDMDCNGNCCEGICGDNYDINAFLNQIPDYGQSSAGLNQCCTMLERDYCGICGGSSTGVAGEGDVGCDGICFSGLTTQACGCGIPGTESPTLHCYDSDGDNLGEGAPVSLCGATTQNPSEGTTGNIIVWVQEDICSDPYTNCKSNTIDECGVCIEDNGDVTENTLCYGCNREDACNFGMSKSGYVCGWGGSEDEPDYEGPCRFHDEDVCVFPESCGDCGGTYCIDTTPSNHSIIPNVDIYLGGWGNHLGDGGSSYSLSCAGFVVSDCPTAEGCHEESGKLTYCISGGENINDNCYYKNHCGNCTLGNHNSETGDWGCYADGVNQGIDWNNCDCAGCMSVGCPEYDEHVLINGTAPQYQIPDSCSLNDCNGVCGGDAVVDNCGVCDGPGEAYACGCTEPENFIIGDCDYMNDFGAPCGCDSSQTCSGCTVCSESPDVCGECGPDWGGCGGRDCSCTGCMDDTSPEYNESALVPDESCRWLDCNNNSVCTQPWEFDEGTSSPSIHNTYCSGGYVYDDCGNCIEGTTDNYLFNNCATCNTEGALNYIAPCDDGDDECQQTPGPCFYGDLLMIPSVETSQGFDTYIFRPVGPVTNGNQCTEVDAVNCNHNYGGVSVIDTGGVNAQVNEYNITIKSTTSEGTENYVNATAHLNGCQDSNGCGNSISADNPYCPDNFGGMGTYNILTLVSCGLGKKFYIDGVYEITLRIGTSVGFFEFSKELIITDTIGYEPSMSKNIMDNSYNKPWQGINLGTTLPENFNYTKQHFIDYDNDKRPSLGLFYYSDYPNNYVDILSNLVDDNGEPQINKGYIDVYYKDDTSISGVKWGGVGGIGKEYEGLIPNIEKECGVDIPVIRSDTALSESPTSGTGFGSNEVCRVYSTNMQRWVPDAMAYTQRALTGNKSRLWRYYDNDISPYHYDETTGPTQAIILWQTLTENKMLHTTSVYPASDTNPIYLIDVDWGDGKMSHQKNPYNLTENGPITSHAYDKPGIYEITGYMFSMKKSRTCIHESTGEKDGRNVMCINNQHCYGYCDVTSNTCVGGGNDGSDCGVNSNNCHTNTNDFGDFTKQIICQPEDTPISDYLSVGVDRFFKFELRININEPEGYNKHPYVLNNNEVIQPIVGGLSDKSIYQKNIKRQLGFFPDVPSSESLDLYFQYSYDQYMTEYSLLQMDESYINDGLGINAFMSTYSDINCNNPACASDVPVYNYCRACPTDGTTDIWSGKYNEHWGSLGKSIGNSDIGQVRYFDTSISMAEMLGMTDEFAGNPGLESYWENIIPKTFQMTDRVDTFEFNNPDNSYDITSVSEIVSQNWKDNYYYPVLPKINRYGKFDMELGYQETGGVDRIPFGNDERESWDMTDGVSLVTAVNSTEFNGNLLLDIDFASQSDGKLQDLSGNGNDAYITADYRIDYEQKTRVPEKTETQLKPELDTDGKQF